MTNYDQYKIPIYPDINDVPSTGEDVNHPNASLLCKQYNDLIVELNTLKLTVESAGSYDLVSLQTAVTTYGQQLANFQTILNNYGAEFYKIRTGYERAWIQGSSSKTIYIYGDDPYTNKSPTLGVTFIYPMFSTEQYVEVFEWEWDNGFNQVPVAIDVPFPIPEIGTLTIYQNGSYEFVPYNGYRGSFIIKVKYEAPSYLAEGGFKQTYVTFVVVDAVTSVLPPGGS